MKRHLTERELIEYLFKLGSAAEMELAGEHLGECESCRAELERLERKFAALDMLRDDVKASEGLIARAIEQASEPGPVKIAAYRKIPAWASAAAAVVVVGVLVLLTTRPWQEKLPEPFAKAPTSESVKSIQLKPGSKSEGFTANGTAVLSRSALGIPEKAPFAPASAIELVTLPRRDGVQLTIYNSADLTLVRERRNLTLKRGWNWLQFMWANTLIDPTSLSIEPQEHNDKIDIQQLVFPARLRELGRWLIRSEVSGQVPFEITYFTSGLSWRAFYMGTLSQDEKTMSLKSYVRIDNGSGEEYENAQTRLIVGKVHLLEQIAQLARRQYAYDSPVQTLKEKRAHIADQPGDRLATLNGYSDAWGRHDVSALAWFDLADLGGDGPKEIKKEGLSEYFLYTIEGTETIPDKWGKRLQSMEAEDIEVENLYKYDEDRWGTATIRFVKFSNDEDHNLGDTPLPDGTFRIFAQTDEGGELSYVGWTNVKYIPVNEEVELNLGAARLVKVEPVLVDFATANYRFDGDSNIAGWDEIRTWKIGIANTRNLGVDIEITRSFGTPYWKLDSAGADAGWEKHDATRARVELKLDPQTKRTLEYKVTTFHGARTEDWRQ
ncbi:MAG: DUF4139 domain-containing protein [Sedimentisphaerales bacterium]|nr:DUF4139 domain-containing protein [Sedimentisphaerales bacterium]